MAITPLRARLERDFPIKEEGVARLILDSIAHAPANRRTQCMDELSMTYIRSGLPDPFDQRTREAILMGELDETSDD